MKETIVEESLIEVQYHEPSNQTVVRISSATRSDKDSDCSPESVSSRVPEFKKVVLVLNLLYSDMSRHQM